MMAITSYLRTVASDTPKVSFFVLSFSYLLISSVTLTAVKCYKKDEFRMSWCRKVTVMVAPESGYEDTTVTTTEWKFSKF